MINLSEKNFFELFQECDTSRISCRSGVMIFNGHQISIRLSTKLHTASVSRLLRAFETSKFETDLRVLLFIAE